MPKTCAWRPTGKSDTYTTECGATLVGSLKELSNCYGCSRKIRLELSERKTEQKITEYSPELPGFGRIER